ncbi:MAG TPA: restriction endonuclease [Ramlibacter sp.]|jgi:restriction system protein|uniref:restriction endonuclease n=1 Tax=Ramlibacter sp. TaxID=1917967 RepID=UPI002D3FBBA4|nr:restriction endonuclease [Ramlibacter sp.]HZY17718.1 restriction endonuclease [Ramlibacter sp.]
MKFRMAPNSVFAILLRSPWWISLLLAAAVAAAAQALLPAEVRNVGSAAGLPFLGVAGVALWRQWRAPGAGEVQAVLARVAALGWADFERELRDAFARGGHAVQAASGGADLLLERQGRRTLVAARRWKAARPGEEALQALHASMARQDVERGLFVTLGEPSPQAGRFAAAHGIELVRGDALVRLLRR